MQRGSPAGDEATREEERAAKRQLARWVGLRLALWAVLLLAFVALWAVFSPR